MQHPKTVKVRASDAASEGQGFIVKNEDDLTDDDVLYDPETVELEKAERVAAERRRLEKELQTIQAEKDAEFEGEDEEEDAKPTSKTSSKKETSSGKKASRR